MLIVGSGLFFLAVFATLLVVWAMPLVKSQRGR